MKRRSFIQNSALAAVGGLLMPSCKPKSEAISTLKNQGLRDIGVQLYTLRNEMNTDLIGTLENVAKIGFTHIENIGYKEGLFYGLPKEEFKKILADNNLKMYSGHTETGQNNPAEIHTMVNNWEKHCEDVAFMDQKYVVCAYLHEGERQTIDQYKSLAQLFNKCGEKAKEFGLQFAFHHHDFEFVKIDDIVPFDILLNETDPELVKFELDHYWLAKSNVTTDAFYEQYPKRFPLWHIKDMADDEAKSFSEVGNGILDWKDIFSKREQSGMEFFYVEQDFCKNFSPLESVKISFDYLASLSI